ncbi:MAG: hypothetical protein HN341_03995 [Verrucomicrobia bacterium]|nr:hypothetical protein [Verrucomicrobiota bacterium]
MNDTKYGCKFSVLAVPDRAEMFLMNMRVYNVVPQTSPPTSNTDPVSVIWCAVYNVTQLERSN